MSRETVGKLIDQWINDPEFHRQMRADPAGTVERCGVRLEPDEWAALRNVDWSLSDEELRGRANFL